MNKKSPIITFLLSTVLFSLEANHNIEKYIPKIAEQINALEFYHPKVQGWTPFEQISLFLHQAGFKQEKPNPNIQIDGKTLLMYFMEKVTGNRIEALKRLLKVLNNYMMDINVIADNGMTALTFAASRNDNEMVEGLITYGKADVNQPDAFGKTYRDYLIENEIKRKEKVEEELRREFEFIRTKEELEEEREKELEKELEEWEIIG